MMLPSTRKCKIIFILVTFFKSSCQDCRSWFDDEQTRSSRCESYYRKWCPAAASICGDPASEDVSTGQQNSGPPNPPPKTGASTSSKDTEAQSNSFPGPPPTAKVSPKRQESPPRRTSQARGRASSSSSTRDCSQVFVDKPSRCDDDFYKRYCPSGAQQICQGQGQDTETRCSGGDCKGQSSGSKSGSIGANVGGNSASTAAETRRSPAPRPPPKSVTSDRSRPSVDQEPKKSTEPKPKPKKKILENSETSSKRGPPTDAEKDSAFRDCAGVHNVPSTCQKFASFTDWNTQEMACEDPECVDELGKMIYCASNGKNHQKCCVDSGVDKVCEPFCDGSEPLVVDQVFKSVGSALKYLPCIQKERIIVGCHKKLHSGENEAPFKKYSGEVKPSMKKLIRSYC